MYFYLFLHLFLPTAGLVLIREYAFKLLNNKFSLLSATQSAPVYLFLTIFFSLLLFSLFIEATHLHLGCYFSCWENSLLYCSPSSGSAPSLDSSPVLTGCAADAKAREGGKDLSSALAAAADTKVTKVTLHLPISVSLSNTSIQHHLNIILTIISLIVGYKLAKDIPSTGGKIIAIIGVVASAHLVTAGVNFIGDILSSYNF